MGDAASLMTPFGGEGVNKAMKDSLELAALIEKSQDPSDDLILDQAVLLYKQLMFPRAEKVQATTMKNEQNSFGPDAPIATMTSDSPLMLEVFGSHLIRVLMAGGQKRRCIWLSGSVRFFKLESEQGSG